MNADFSYDINLFSEQPWMRNLSYNRSLQTQQIFIITRDSREYIKSDVRYMQGIPSAITDNTAT